MPTSVPLRPRCFAGRCAAVMAACALFAVSPAHAISVISIEAPPAVLPGQTFPFLVRISGSAVIAGYDLELLINPLGGSTGSLTGDAVLSNFYLSENVIEQGGGGIGGSSIDSLLPDNPGLMFQAFDLTFPPIAVPGPGQDILAEVFMTASGDAEGEFEIVLGPGTLLVTENAEIEPYEPVMVTVRIPEPGYLGILSGLAVLMLRRQRQV